MIVINPVILTILIGGLEMDHAHWIQAFINCIKFEILRFDKQIREETKHFAAFRMHLTIFILVLGILWLLWLMDGTTIFYPWLLIPTLIWGGLLAVHCIIVYVEFNRKRKLRRRVHH